MPDSSPPHPPHDAADIAARVSALEADARESRDHRTRVQTLLTLAGAVALLVVLGAVSTRDATRDATAEVANVRSRVTQLETATTARASDDRRTSDALIRLSATVETLQTTIAARLDVLEQRLPRTAAPR